MTCRGQDHQHSQARTVTLLLSPSPPTLNNSQPVRSFVETDIFGQRIEYSIMEQSPSDKRVPVSRTISVVQVPDDVTNADGNASSDCELYRHQESIASSSSSSYDTFLIYRPDPSEICEVTLGLAASADVHQVNQSNEQYYTPRSSVATVDTLAITVDESESETVSFHGTIDISSSSELESLSNLPLLLPIADILAAPHQESFGVVYACNSRQSNNPHSIPIPRRQPDGDRIKDYNCKGVSVLLKRLDASKIKNDIVDLRRYRNHQHLFIKPKKAKKRVDKVKSTAEDKNVKKNSNVVVVVDDQVLPRLRSTRFRRNLVRYSP